jgi:hypothetical protein
MTESSGFPDGFLTPITVDPRLAALEAAMVAAYIPQPYPSWAAVILAALDATGWTLASIEDLKHDMEMAAGAMAEIARLRLDQHGFVSGGFCMSKCRSCGRTFSDPVHGEQSENIRRLRAALARCRAALAAQEADHDPR